MSSERDREIRELLVAAHQGERQAPDFDRLLARPRRRRSLAARWVPVAAALALAVAIAGPLLELRREHEALEFARELAAWRAPTDRLLTSSSNPQPVTDPLRGLGGPSVLGDTNQMIRWR